MAKTTANISIDSDTKIKAQKLFANLGMDLSTEINIFLKQAIRVKGIPFEISCDVPNRTTMRTIRKAEEGKELHGPVNSAKELMEELDAED